MNDGRTTVVEIETELMEALRELYPRRSDRDILEGIVRAYLLERSTRSS